VAWGGSYASVVVVEEETLPSSPGKPRFGTVKSSTSAAPLGSGASFCRNVWVPVLGHRTSRFLVCRLLLVCMCASVPDEYSASMPSGIITTKDVPTRTPIPIVEISRSCDEDKVMDNGNAPARKDLLTVSKSSKFRDITHAKAITTLSASNKNSPSNILTPGFNPASESEIPSLLFPAPLPIHLLFLLNSQSRRQSLFTIQGESVVCA
jgi:hypothetical protein